MSPLEHASNHASVMRLYIVGGFLGAGKTTLIRAVAERLSAHGERVAIITNDQGHALVDTALCQRVTDRVSEITGGCFCCRFDDLEGALAAASDSGATVVFAEAVGSCTDLVATVLAPLADKHPGRFLIAPFAVVVDPWRMADVDAGRAHEDVAYLFRKQIEEADVVLLSRADLDAPDVRAAVRAIRRDVTILSVSGVTGAGLAEWLSARPTSLARPLDIDYDRYADAEALLGWSNARVRIKGDAPFSPAEVARGFLSRLRDAPVAHVKLTSLSPAGGRAALVRMGADPSVDFGAAPASEAVWLVNARVALAPEALVDRMKTALAESAAPAGVSWEEIEAFSPSRPNPTHRYTQRCSADSDASCCATSYDLVDVRALLGNA